MTKKRTLLLLGLAFMLSASISGQKREINILSANDMHATIGAFPQVAAIADSLRAIDPELLVFSAGDNRTGEPLNDKYEIPAYPMVALMNQVGFNASALGNHEFDVHSLARLTGLANFRYLCCNMTAAPESGIRTLPYQVFDVKGLRVAVIGTIQLSPQGIPSTHPDNLDGLHFKPAKEVVGQYEWLRREADVVILLSHQGYEEDREMADAFPWVDLIIGGHTHTQLKGGEMQNGVLITQNKNKLPRVTHITITLDGDSIVEKRSEYIDVKAFSQKNKLVQEMVRFFCDNPQFKRVLAQVEKPFEAREELGCMMCDAYLDGCNAEIAVENPGGVRVEGHPVGDFTVHDVLEMDPFDNHAVVLDLTGYELAHMLLTYCHYRLNSFPFVGGMRCVINVEKDSPRKIKSVQLLTPEGKKMDMKRRYRVATNSYVPATSEVPQGAAHMMNVMTTDIIMQFLEKKGTVNYQGVRRLEVRNER